MIHFSKFLDADYLLPINNNNTIEFYSDSILAVVNATFIVNAQPIVLYPKPNGRFYFNFLEYVESIIEVADTTDYAQEVTDVSNKLIFDYSGTLKINFVDATFETSALTYKFFDFVLNKDNLLLQLVAGSFLLNSNLIRYWEGLPFSFQIYNGTTTPIEFNADGLPALAITTTGDVTSYTVNGKNIENYFKKRFVELTNITQTTPWVLGSQAGEIIESQINGTVIGTANGSGTILEVDYISQYCEGFYIKWLNHLGGWNYWLFEKYDASRKTIDLGEVENNIYDLNESVSPYVQIGKDSKDTVTVETDNLFTHLFLDLLESQKIFMFMFNNETWQEVSLVADSQNIKNSKEVPKNMRLKFEMPKRNTRKL